MSNQVVGSVYQQVIERVIQASQNDFEEFGVDQSTLEELKQGWQEKLTALHVAQFPWDPQPEPVRQPPTVPSNVKQEPDVTPAMPISEHGNFSNVPIKTERGYETSVPSYPQHSVNGFAAGGYNGDLAAQRAQALVAQRIGSMPMQHQVPLSGQQRMMANQQQQRPPQQMPPRPAQGYNPSQTDGAEGALEDWRALMSARAAATAAGPDGRIAADEFMRARVDAMASQQDSGLMMPLEDMPKGRKRKAITRVLQAQRAEQSSHGPSSLPVIAPFDGELEKEPEEDPDDAINSDLDDPEDDDNGDGGSDDETMDYMLCTYDKVQRVKNKWKCTLKDGILTTNKKEYLFHKANGEFEW